MADQHLNHLKLSHIITRYVKVLSPEINRAFVVFLRAILTDFSRLQAYLQHRIFWFVFRDFFFFWGGDSVCGVCQGFLLVGLGFFLSDCLGFFCLGLVFCIHWKKTPIQCIVLIIFFGMNSPFLVPHPVKLSCLI